MGSEPGGWNSSSCSQLSCWGGLGLSPPNPTCLPCTPSLQPSHWVVTPMAGSLWPSACPETTNQHLISCLCSGHVLPGRQEVQLSPLHFSLLLPDCCLADRGWSESCSSPLEHSLPFQSGFCHTFHKHFLYPSSKASIKMLARPGFEASLCRFGSEPSLTTLHAVFQPLVSFPP